MKKKAIVYPSKTRINLAIKEKSNWRLGRVLPMFLALAAAVVLFSKFAVIDRLAEVEREQQALSALQSQAADLSASLSDYDEVLAQYRLYSVGWMTDEEKALVDRVGILDLIEQELTTAATVQQLSISGNVLSVNLSGVTLEDTSNIVQQLYTWPEVSTVSVYTASTQVETGVAAQISMVITLAQPTEGGGQ